MISTKRYWTYIVLVLLVYLAGMPVTLMENDSAQFAVMAMRMVQENDFWNLFKGPEEYLDKPHMHYWLAALSFKLFGLYDWAYRVPGILATLLGAYSCFGLGRLLYNPEVGRLASLIFMTAQTIVLGAIDVRTDAVLTGFAIFAIWQLAAYVEKGGLWNLVLGAFGAGMAFSTKGQIALVVIGICLLCHLAHGRQWKLLWNGKVLVALLVFAITISPMLYAYYQQFDLHPEKVIRGRDHRSGIFFIFWEQSFERMSGEGMGKNSSDYLFFFHTFLWVFLPWTPLAVLGYWERLRAFFRQGPAPVAGREFLTFGGIGILFLLISFAQFKLPHYLNVLIPLFAVLSAAFLFGLYSQEREKLAKILLGLQLFILGLVALFVILIGTMVFPFAHWSAYLALLVALALVGGACLNKEAPALKLVTVSICSALLLNAFMNLHFYPRLLEYQGGSTLASVVTDRQLPVEEIYKISDRYSWALDFYLREPVKHIPSQELKGLGAVWVYADDKELERLKKEGFQWTEKISVDHFRITRLQLAFLNPATRAEKLEKQHLVRLVPR